MLIWNYFFKGSGEVKCKKGNQKILSWPFTIISQNLESQETPKYQSFFGQEE